MSDKDNKQSDQIRGEKANKVFWATILFLAFATLAMIIVGSLRHVNDSARFANKEIIEPTCQPDEVATQTAELNADKENLKENAALDAYYKVVPSIDKAMNSVYAPVYAQIPVYAKFHYSIIGEYMELFAAAGFGDVEKDIEKRFFKGFDEKLAEEMDSININYNKAFNSSLDEEKSVLKYNFDCITAKIEQLITTARNEIKESNLSMASLAGGGKVSAVLAGKITAKFSAKLVAKGLIKGASTLGGAAAGAGVGAVACSWAGPFAVICAGAGAVAGWFLIDGVVVNISEIWGREEFEADLKGIIDKHKQETSAQIKVALQGTAIQNGVPEDSFTLQNLSTDK